MANFFSFFFFSFRLLIIILLPLLVLGIDDCGESRCRKGGPRIRFPFKLKHEQAQHCGYPGFELSCDNNGNTVMEFPHAVQLHVDRIDYVSQQIFLSDPHACVPGKMLLNLNLSETPFQYSNPAPILLEYSLFNCSDDASKYPENFDDQIIPCLGVPGHQVHAFYSFMSIDYFPSPSCVKFHETTLPFQKETLSSMSTLHLNWSRPSCSHCETQGKFCSLNNTLSAEVQCLNRPKKTGSKTLIIAGNAQILIYLSPGTS